MKTAPAPVAERVLESAAFYAAAAAAGVGAVFWACCQVGLVFGGGRWRTLPPAGVPAALARLPAHLSAPLSTWPEPATGPVALQVRAAIGFWVAAAVAAAVGLGVALRLAGARPSEPGARWATRADLQTLLVRRPLRGRVVMGRWGRRLVATEARHSLLVIGPTQSGKSSGLAIPAILEWRGPVVATSVKDDLATATLEWRARAGPCAVFDPTAGSGHRSRRWSPVSACSSWSAAQKVASWLVESTPGRQGMADSAFWYTTAAKQLAPLLLAAHRSDLTMADVVRWTNTANFDEPSYLLELSGDVGAATALAACAGRDERIRSSVSTTLETVLAPFEDPAVAESTAATDLPLDQLLHESGTLYLCGPSHEQQRVAGVFATLVSSMIDLAVAAASAAGGTLDPPLLLVLDEAANIAPLRDLDTIASTAAALGIQLVTVCQDLAQLATRYGPDRARTIANNHRAKLLLSGVADLGTLDLMSGLAGEARVREVATTRDLESRGRSRSTSTVLRRLAPTDWLRRTPPGEGVLVYGHLAPARLKLRPWYEDRRLSARGPRRPERGPTRWPRRRRRLA